MHIYIESEQSTDGPAALIRLTLSELDVIEQALSDITYAESDELPEGETEESVRNLISYLAEARNTLHEDSFRM